MIKTIIAAVDFSDSSFNAANYAASMSNIFNAELVLVHAFMNPMAIDQMSAELSGQTNRELTDVLDEFMKQNVEILQKKFTVKIDSIVKEGPASIVLEQCVRERNADLVVMGMKGKGKSNSLFGSTTLTHIRKSKVPVLVIPEKAEFKSIETITLASDFDEETELANYNLLKTIAERNNTFVQILNVRKKETKLSSSEIAGKLNTGTAFNEIPHKFFTVEDDEVDDGIEDFLEDNPSDMLVMLSRRHNIFKRIFGTIHTRKMMYETEIPLLVLQDK
ncbi:MAG: universal stress protein [Ginsengibacter sp.]|jgi:nucleotide-binding universal stress UspA family protein